MSRKHNDLTLQLPSPGQMVRPTSQLEPNDILLASPSRTSSKRSAWSQVTPTLTPLSDTAEMRFLGANVSGFSAAFWRLTSVSTSYENCQPRFQGFFGFGGGDNLVSRAFSGWKGPENKVEKLPLNSSRCAVTADSKSRCMTDGKIKTVSSAVSFKQRAGHVSYPPLLTFLLNLTLSP